MFPDTSHEPRATSHEPPRARRRAAGGFSIVTAIFLIVVLAALGAFIVSVSGLQQSSSQLDVQGVRAYQAARAGIEWAAYQVLDPNNNQPGIGGTDNLPACPAPTTTLPSLAGSLSVFTVTVTCSDNVGAGVTEGNRKIATYEVVSTACNQSPCPNPSPGTGYVERRLTAVLSKCKDPTAAAPRFACGG
ncbi:MAG: hypothetical protein HYY78_18205 [Betaproteobacteria bacterium]|nr:hypothetical protein [Betaproteobacteria bacterium]